jgi:hypothetical protein
MSTIAVEQESLLAKVHPPAAANETKNPTLLESSFSATINAPIEKVDIPSTWARRAYRNLIYYHQVGKGGHFAGWEPPQLFSEELRAAFKSLCSSWLARFLK